MSRPLASVIYNRLCRLYNIIDLINLLHNALSIVDATTMQYYRLCCDGPADRPAVVEPASPDVASNTGREREGEDREL